MFSKELNKQNSDNKTHIWSKHKKIKKNINKPEKKQFVLFWFDEGEN